MVSPRESCKSWLFAMLIMILAFALAAPVLAAPSGAGPTPSTGFSAQHNPHSLDDQADLEAFFDGFMNAQLAAYHFPGAQVAVVRNDRVLFLKGYGYADLERQIPVDAERSLFRPGSVAKLFTWTAVMQLVEQSKLNLDVDINNYLADFKIPATFPQPVTMRHLMTHTPGFEDQGIGIFQTDAADLKPLGEYLAQNMPARVFPPGKVSAYSNYGASLAGYIVARVSGQPFEEYIADHILAPLGMARSTFYQPLPQHLFPDLASGYTYVNGGFQLQPTEMVQVVPAGALSTTADDIARFMIAHLGDGRYEQGRILQEATAREMHQHQYSDAPGLGGMALGFMESRIGGLRLIVHSGDTVTFHSLLALIPDHHVGLYVSYNGSGTGSAMLDGRSDLLVAFLERYLSAPTPERPSPAAEYASQAHRFNGYYYPARSNFTTPEKILNLIQPIQVSVDPSGMLTLSYSILMIRAAQVGPNEFQQVGGEHQRIVFQENAAGQVTGITLENIPAMYIFKTPWYGNPLLHQILLLVCVLIFSIGLVKWPRRLRLDRLELASPASRLARLALWAGFLMALVNLVFVVGTGIAFIQLMAAPVAIPPLLKALMWLPVLSGLLALVMLFLALAAWNGRWWNTGGRLFYTLGVVAGIGFILFAAYWNLWVL